MENRTVVFFSSFSPATRAYLAVLRAAMRAVGAQKGVFLPEPLAAVRKTAKAEERNDILNDKLRVELLRLLLDGDESLAVDSTALRGTEQGISPRLWGEIRRNYPGERLFVIRDQRWPYLLAKLPERDAVVDRFSFAILQRPGQQAEKAFERVQWLSLHRDAFVVFELPEGLETQESDVRRGLRAGDERFKEAVGEAGWQFLEEFGYQGYRRVGLFRGAYRFLSNFYPARVELDGVVYQNSEAAYQAQKCVSREERLQFADLEPLDAKNRGAWVYLREDWDAVQLDAMKNVLHAKFTQNPTLGRLLVGTGNKVLCEGNTWGDLFWGVNIYTGEGENYLGRLLEQLRDELRGEGVLPLDPLSFSEESE